MTSVSSTSEFHHQHHFKSAEHQYASSKQGIWLFLCTEILMFGGLFVGYLIYHSLYPAVFKNGSHTLDWKMGAVNTVVLLISSFTMAAAINFVQRGLHKIASIMLILTIACAGAFMVIKYFEYTHKFHVGTVPGKFSLVDPTCGSGGNRSECETKIGALLKSEELRHKNHVSEEEAARLQAVISRPKWEMFYGFYFIMTGLHGVHVVVGALMIFWILIKTLRKKVGPEYYTPVEGVGLFWHVVDLVWIYLFPLLYLVG
ncbi:cytochrome c oxidase subunit 3 family protein [Leptospira ilyithenensis]|uniref:Cytochrome c oxidase subunit 3 family protein n=1 Tax=Leptospira ilyithenensis TaxID=2484901 RepID=A0A4R9LL66_9LEPT|nr:cytochrome c oxidase subunit 3 family protein [Leptospira ilyithenensis]TGN06975.1 cytochrome c oxidase subunit 3 family protein [Leptospira ilyithenensis]